MREGEELSELRIMLSSQVFSKWAIGIHFRLIYYYATTMSPMFPFYTPSMFGIQIFSFLFGHTSGMPKMDFLVFVVSDTDTASLVA